MPLNAKYHMLFDIQSRRLAANVSNLSNKCAFVQAHWHVAHLGRAVPCYWKLPARINNAGKRSPPFNIESMLFYNRECWRVNMANPGWCLFDSRYSNGIRQIDKKVFCDFRGDLPAGLAGCGSIVYDISPSTS